MPSCLHNGYATILGMDNQTLPTNPQNQNINQSPQPPGVPTPGIPPTTPQPSKSPKKKFLVIGVVAFIFIAVVVFAAVILLSQQANSPSQPNETSTNSQNQQTGTTLTKVTEGTTTAEVTHPASWEVKEEPEELAPGVTLSNTTITSAKGNTLRLAGNAGVGGDCDADNYSFTLTQKLSTATSGIFFTEYTTTSPNFPLSGLSIDTTDFDVANKQVGAKGNDVCTNKIGFYSIVGELGKAENEVFVIVGSPKSLDPNQTKYSDIEDDTEFIAMLQSLKVTTAQ